MMRVDRVKTSIPIEGSADRVVLTHWGADNTPRLDNVSRRDGADQVIWRAPLPGQAERDCFVALRRDGAQFVARTYTGLETRFDASGRVLKAMAR